ncbi:phage tail protein [Streptomyces sp. H34-S4]|uniref:phage tail protein n=1 Tax=Streptomyces sp. H34-S4 TaxID=2996463 RepID=UPI002271D198|nr:hypothetical protein [Streptomyces sp. H34-S4]MCY0933627.1 hypothetical protein [Streptomyces sp. H34-S4]
MPAGQVIGRVSVKVLPDTSDFRRQAQKDLDKIEKTLKLTVATKVDMSGASREFLEQLRTINQRNRNMDSRKIRFHATISKDGMTQAVSKAVRDLQDKAKQSKIKFKVDDVEVTGDIKLKLDQQSADDAKDAIERWKRDVSPVEVPVKLDFSTGAAAIVSAHIAFLTRPRTVQILPKLNNTAVAALVTSLAALSGARVLNSIFERLGRSLKNLDKSVPIIGSLATAIAGLAGWGLTAASNLFALSSSLAQIGPLALLLPGLLGGIAVGLGVTIAAFRDFNKILPEVKGKLSDLQNQISDNFWAKAKEPIRDLVDGLLPKFSAGLSNAATEVGLFFGAFAGHLKGALDPALAQMFTDLSASIAIATGGTSAFAGIIATLGSIGTSYLPELATWFVSISERFDTFLKTAKADGSLDQWIKTGIQNLRDLGGVLSNLGGIFAGISRAATAAGGSTLGMLNDTLTGVHKVVDSPGFQTGLTAVFEAAHTAMSNIADISGPAVKNLFITLGQLMTSILPQVGTIIGTVIGSISAALAQPAITQGVQSMFNGIQVAVQALAPAMAPLGLALGALMNVISTFMMMLGPLVSAALIPLAQAFTQLAPMISPIITLLGGTLLGVFQQLTPIIMSLVPVVGQMLGAAFQVLGTILPVVAQLFMQIMAAVAPLIAQLVTALVPIMSVIAAVVAQVISAVMPLVTILLNIISAIITPLIPMIQTIVETCLPPLADAFQRVAEAVQPLLSALLAIVNFLMPILVPILQFIIEILVGALTAAINGVALVLEGLVMVFTGVWDAIVGYFKVVWGLFEGLFTGNWDTFNEGFSQLWSGIVEMLHGIWNIILGALEVFFNIGILGIAGKGLKAIGQLFKAGWTAVKEIGESLWASIAARFSSFLSSLSSAPGAALSAILRFFRGTWDDIKTAVSQAGEAIVSSVRTHLGSVGQFFSSLPGKILGYLSGFGSLLTDAGRRLIQGLIDGISGMIGKVKDKLKGLTDSLPDWKGPAYRDSTLLKNAGRLVIDGFIVGLESRYDAVRKSLQGLTDDVGSTVIGSPAVGQFSASGVTSALAGMNASSNGGGAKVLNYYAAPGSSLGAEEDLFTAANRARMVGW